MSELHKELGRILADPNCEHCKGTGFVRVIGNDMSCGCTPTTASYGNPRIDELINQCPEDHGECYTCSELCCPHNDMLHFHHDGCPSCAARESQ